MQSSTGWCEPDPGSGVRLLRRGRLDLLSELGMINLLIRPPIETLRDPTLGER